LSGEKVDATGYTWARPTPSRLHALFIVLRGTEVGTAAVRRASCRGMGVGPGFSLATGAGVDAGVTQTEPLLGQQLTQSG
jgi:hypothetical protein